MGRARLLSLVDIFEPLSEEEIEGLNGHLDRDCLAGGLAMEPLPCCVRKPHGDLSRHRHVLRWLELRASQPSRRSLSHAVRNLFAAILAGMSFAESSETCL